MAGVTSNKAFQTLIRCKGWAVQRIVEENGEYTSLKKLGAKECSLKSHIPRRISNQDVQKVTFTIVLAAHLRRILAAESGTGGIENAVEETSA